MKYIITENKLNNVALSWMNKYFGLDQLEIFKSEKYPNSVFFRKNGEVVMLQDKKSKFFWFDYDKIWLFFESFFGMEYQQIQDVLNYWLKETLKLEGYTPASTASGYLTLLKETLKLEGYTPHRIEANWEKWLEETPNERLNESDEPKHKTVTRFERMLKPALEMLNKMSEGWNVHHYNFNEMNVSDGKTIFSYWTNLIDDYDKSKYNHLSISENLLDTMMGFFPLIDKYVIMEWFNIKYNRDASDVDVMYGEEY